MVLSVCLLPILSKWGKQRSTFAYNRRFLGATALGILAFKDFTTITNIGSELKNPKRNVGRAIMISIALCMVIYALVGFAAPATFPYQKLLKHKIIRWPLRLGPRLVKRRLPLL
ncbi:hypothetical protein HSBAA_PA_1610 (plasmid) [Vreelandella sulfidaeris]|uniref:Amino acid permease/ SLC12A domain-containing protein n=1 Tax=Vreelandella sulfidaeris TaxID=115553 RepID=A0A455UMK2_9GAMM|nr:hypothetical protein HSBAA_PA_1610 [Halomonas sulfidaeris]